MYCVLCVLCCVFASNALKKGIYRLYTDTHFMYADMHTGSHTYTHTHSYTRTHIKRYQRVSFMHSYLLICCFQCRVECLSIHFAPTPTVIRTVTVCVGYYVDDVSHFLALPVYVFVVGFFVFPMWILHVCTLPYTSSVAHIVIAPARFLLFHTILDVIYRLSTELSLFR